MPARSTKSEDGALLGQHSWSKGGKARAEKLHPDHLSAIGKMGAKSRWKDMPTRSKTIRRTQSR